MVSRERRIFRGEVPEGQKYCPDCETIKDHSAFHKLKTGKSGLNVYCIACMRIRGSNNKEGRAHAIRKYKYGLTKQQFCDLIVAQDNKCRICYEDFGEALMSIPRVDHCHNTGVIRGLLCFKCNTGLGMFCDDPEKMRSAIAYLAQNS